MPKYNNDHCLNKMTVNLEISEGVTNLQFYYYRFELLMPTHCRDFVGNLKTTGLIEAFLAATMIKGTGNFYNFDRNTQNLCVLKHSWDQRSIFDS